MARPSDLGMVPIKYGSGALVLLIRRSLAKLRNTVNMITKQMECRSRLDASMPTEALWKSLQTIGIRERQPFCNINPNKLNDHFLETSYVAGDWSFVEVRDLLSTYEDAFQFLAFTMGEVWKAVYCMKSDAVGYDNAIITFLKPALPAVVLLIDSLTH